MKKFLLMTNLLVSMMSMAQVGVNNDNPTEGLDVNGTTRVRNLPLDGTVNAINTKADGTKSSAQDQTFTATKTVVVDNNGVVGYVDGLPVSEIVNVKTIKYVRVDALLDANTPVNSVATIGTLSIRYNNTNANNGNWIEFKVAQPNNVTAVVDVEGAGGRSSSWQITASNTTTWYKVSNQSIYPSGNLELAPIYITLNNSQEVYRVTISTNAAIAASTTPAVPAVPAQITIFLEQLQ